MQRLSAVLLLCLLVGGCAGGDASDGEPTAATASPTTAADDPDDAGTDGDSQATDDATTDDAAAEASDDDAAEASLAATYFAPLFDGVPLTAQDVSAQLDQPFVEGRSWRRHAEEPPELGTCVVALDRLRCEFVSERDDLHTVELTVGLLDGAPRPTPEDPCPVLTDPDRGELPPNLECWAAVSDDRIVRHLTFGGEDMVYHKHQTMAHDGMFRAAALSLEVSQDRFGSADEAVAAAELAAPHAEALLDVVLSRLSGG